MNGQVNLGKNVVDIGDEKEVVECNVRLVEVSNNVCLGNDFQEEADQENIGEGNNSEASNDQTKKGTHTIDNKIENLH